MIADDDPSRAPFVVVRTTESMDHPLVNRWLVRDDVTCRGRDILLLTSGPDSQLQAIARRTDRVENDDEGQLAQVYDIHWAKITSQPPPL
jgi:hypothetical protein